jgi:uncharacterized protein YoxC
MVIEAAQAAGNDQLFATLVQLAPAFDQLQKGLAELGQAAQNSTDILRQRIDLENRLLQLIGNTDQIRARELAGIDETNQGIMQTIYAVEDAQNALESAMEGLVNAVEQERTDALARLETEHNALMRTLEDQKSVAELARDVASESAKGLESLFKYIGSQIEQINRDVDASRMAAAGMQFISQALINAQRTGYLPNQDELSSAVSAARGGLSAQNFATSFEMRRANLQLAGKLTLLGELTEDQLTTAEKQLEIAKTTIVKIEEQIAQQKELYEAEVSRTNEYYDQILEDAQAQINALNGVNSSVIGVQQAVMTVQTAIAQLAAAMAAGNKMTTGFGSGSGGGGGVSDKEKQIFDLYDKILERTPDKDGFEYWMESTDSLEKIASDMELSTENRIQEITRLYDDIFDRIPDIQGLQYWVNSADSLERIAQHLAESPEAQGLRGFASGGYYSGGMAMVGENGPELIDFNQPGMVYNNSQLRNAMNGGDTAAEIRALRDENRAQSRAMVALQSRMTRMIERWDGDGLPNERYEDATA